MWNAISGIATNTLDAAKVHIADVPCSGSPFCTDTCKAIVVNQFYKTCVTCSKLFCKKCCYKLDNTHEEMGVSELNEAEVIGNNGGVLFEGQFVCKFHKDEVAAKLVGTFTERQVRLTDRYCKTFFSDEMQKIIHTRPTSKKEESESLESLTKRWSPFILDVANGITHAFGVGTYAKLAYALYKADGVAQLIMKPEHLAIIAPIARRMEKVKEASATSATSSKMTTKDKANFFLENAICLYYLSLVHKTSSKHATAHDSLSVEEGVVNPQCSVSLVDLLGEYMAAAKWLYFTLGSIHNPESFKWYLSKIVWPQGWTILTASDGSMTFPNGVKKPAFCLAARNIPFVTNNGKEVIISIRGSSEQTDWWINANESPHKLKFEGVEGSVHGGMYHGVLAILDYFGTRSQITEFARLGYKITCVGHSLGAGSAMLLAMELLMHFRRESILNAETIVKCIAYATPAVVTEGIADKMAELGWVSAVLGNDVVPRISHANMQKLCKEVSDFGPEAKRWYAEDKESAKQYLMKAGKRTGDIVLEEVVEADPWNEPLSIISSPTFLQQAISEETEKTKEITLAASAGGDGGVGGEKLPYENDALLVPPGRIIYIKKRSSQLGGYQASEITHRHADLRSIKLVSDDMINDHFMDNYLLAIRGTRLMPGYPAPTHNMPAHSITQVDYSKPIKCSICDLDTSWAFRFHNQASRRDSTMFCCLCLRTVCVVCAPANDKVPVEGISQESLTLDDLRIPVLSRGIPRTPRLCIHCYLDSYKTL